MSTESVVRDPAVTPWALTRAQFDTLVELGEFEGQHVELLEGALVEMTPQGSEHSGLIAFLGDELTVALHQSHGRRYLVRQQLPLAASLRSEPEPDLAVVERPVGLPREHPNTAFLVIEVAFSSQRIDLVHKAPIYAAAGVPEYWVIDLVRRVVVVHREPAEPLVDGGSADRAATYTALETVRFDSPLTVLGVTVRLAELLSG